MAWHWDTPIKERCVEGCDKGKIEAVGRCGIRMGWAPGDRSDRDGNVNNDRRRRALICASERLLYVRRGLLVNP